MKKIFSGIMVMLLLASMLILASNIKQAKPSEPPAREWTRTYRGASREIAFCVIQTGEGYAPVGYTQSYGTGERDFWLVKTDAIGNTKWNQTYGGTCREEAHYGVKTSDGGYTIVGYTHSFSAGGRDS